MAQLERYTAEGQKALIFAREEAIALRHRVIDPEHLVLGILRVKDCVIESLFSRLQIDAARLEETLTFVVGRGNKAILSKPTFGQAARVALQRSRSSKRPPEAPTILHSLRNQAQGCEAFLMGFHKFLYSALAP